MKMMKKIASLVLAGAMTLTMSISAFAAITGVSDAEQKILDTAALKAEELGVPTNSAQYEKYYSQAVTYLQSNDMSAEQIDGALTAMNNATAKAKAAMSEAGVNSLFDLNSSDLKSLAADCAAVIQSEFDKVGIKVKVGSEGNVSFVTEPAGDNTNNKTNNGTTPTEPQKGNTVLQTTNVIKQTGSDMTATVVVAAAVLGAVAVCGIVAKKKDLFTTEV